ncbi:MAG: GntR family transcriptional regulator [Rhodobacterales bacterium]
MPNMPRNQERTVPRHERVYRTLRSELMHGQIRAGTPLTLRGIAQKYGASMTPAREAVRRLSAEGALSISLTGRVTAPALTTDRIEELAAIRALLEPELASRALPRAHMALIERLYVINTVILQAIVKNDPVTFIRSNLEFHRSLYLRAQAPAMLGLVETVWLQLGPTMAVLYEKRKRREASDTHRLVIMALKEGDEAGLRLAIRADVTQGLRMLTSE